MSNLSHEAHTGLPSTELDAGRTPVGSAGLNADSVSLDGVEIGEAHDDAGESADVTANLLRAASAAVRRRDEAA